MKVPKSLQPRFTTVVSPDEYDLDLEIRAMVEEANQQESYSIPMDVGKVVGLYLAYMEALRDKNFDEEDYINF